MAVLIALISLALLACTVEVHSENFTVNIKFYIYPASGPKVEYTSTKTAVIAGCIATGQWAYIIHGWRESTNFVTSPWVGNMVGNLTKARGGCIIAMDYSYYASNNLYPMFVSQFEGIAAVLLANVNKLLEA